MTVLRALRVCLANKEPREPKEIHGPKVLRAYLANRVPKDSKEMSVLRVLRDCQASKVCLATLDPKEFRAKREIRVIPEKR